MVNTFNKSLNIISQCFIEIIASPDCCAYILAPSGSRKSEERSENQFNMGARVYEIRLTC